MRVNDTTFDDDENLQVTFCGTNLPNNAVCCCYHPIRADDGATANVGSRILQWYLKFKYALSLNRNETNNCIYLTFSPNQRLKFYRMFRKNLRNKWRLLTGWFLCKNCDNVFLIIILYRAIAGGWWTGKNRVDWKGQLNYFIKINNYPFYSISYMW